LSILFELSRNFPFHELPSVERRRLFRKINILQTLARKMLVIHKDERSLDVLRFCIEDAENSTRLFVVTL